jgi:two-component system, OmpR family, response regulator
MMGGRRRVLVIEDDAGTTEQLVECLATKGYQIDLAVNGTARPSRARMSEYAVMIVNRMLPRLDGIAIIRRLREAASRRRSA